MQRLRLINLLGLLLSAAALSSCSLRLPDLPAHTYRKEVSTAKVTSVNASSSDKKEQKDPDVLVWLIADELHTGMVFEYDWLLESGFIPPDGFGHPKYVTLSWGNRTAYVEKGLHSPGKFMRAMFTRSPSVMELIPANWNVVEVCPHQRIWRKLVSRERGRDVAAFLNDCSTMGPDGKPIVCGTSSWGGGVLLESRHVYFLPRVCNVWTVHVIEALGGEMNAWLAITANGLIRQAVKPPNDFEQIWWGGGLAPDQERFR
ncbi:MAG: DUF2459 domain-containing protein [Verrucomicrobiaceae bacterium]|nr:MAG: DUF2459 domain-containing protein [Verrucomicrobiaceae bacterium]